MADKMAVKMADTSAVKMAVKMAVMMVDMLAVKSAYLTVEHLDQYLVDCLAVQMDHLKAVKMVV